MVFKPLARTITYYRAGRTVLSNRCVNDCGYCPVVNYPKTTLPSKKALRALIAKSSRRGIRSLEVVAGECIWEQNEIHETLAFFGLPSFDAYIEMIQTEIDQSNCVDKSLLFPVWNIGPLSSTQTRLWRKTLFTTKIVVDPNDPSLWQDGVLRCSPRKKTPHRLDALEIFGKARVPVTAIFNVGIGEDPRKREKTLKQILEMHKRHQHIQSVEVAPCRVHQIDGVAPVAPLENDQIIDILSMARSTLPREIVLQFRPMNNLDILPQVIEAGVRDFSSFYYTMNEEQNTHMDFHLAQIQKYLERMDFRFKERVPLFDRFIERGWFPDSFMKPLEQFAEIRNDKSLDQKNITKAIPTSRSLADQPGKQGK